MPSRTPNFTRPDARSRNYVGRFAPSPTGPLHFGSLFAATASYLDARAHAGRWLLRIDDLDQPRCVPGADSVIMRQLEAYGFEWDGPVLYQSTRDPAYRAALAQLGDAGHTFPCGCTRADIARDSNGSMIYPGTCRAGLGTKTARTIRLRVADRVESFNDRFLGAQRVNLGTEVGDLVLQRADGLYAYPLAVVVDDAAQGVTDIVRGADLLDTTAAQRYTAFQLGLAPASYAHVPVQRDQQGRKLSKQNHAPAIRTDQAAATLSRCLVALGLTLPADLQNDPTVPELWHCALAQWQQRVLSPRGDSRR